MGERAPQFRCGRFHRPDRGHGTSDNSDRRERQGDLQRQCHADEVATGSDKRREQEAEHRVRDNKCGLFFWAAVQNTEVGAHRHQGPFDQADLASPSSDPDVEHLTRRRFELDGGLAELGQGDIEGRLGRGPAGSDQPHTNTDEGTGSGGSSEWAHTFTPSEAAAFK